MNETEQRRYPRYETEMRAELYAKDECISVIMIDIGKCGISLISEKEISPGTDIRIQIKHTEMSAVRGTVKWTEKIRETPRALYRMGIEAEGVIFLEEIEDVRFPERSEYIKSLLSKRRPVKSVLFIDDEEQIRKYVHQQFHNKQRAELVKLWKD